MDETRIQTVDGEPTIEVTKTIVEKQHYKEADLLREKDYFLELRAKADAGLARVETLIGQLMQNGGEVM